MVAILKPVSMPMHFSNTSSTLNNNMFVYGKYKSWYMHI